MKKARGVKINVACPLGNENVEGEVSASTNGLGLAIMCFNPSVIIAAVAKLATKGIINFLLFFVEKNNNETAKTNSSALNTSRDIIKVDSCSVLNFKIKFNIWLSNNKLISNAIFNITNEIIYPLFIR